MHILEQVVGIDPTTLSLATRHSTTELYLPNNGGGDRTRTRYLDLAKVLLSQMSYTPINLALSLECKELL